jgi:hypothetical protein
MLLEQEKLVLSIALSTVSILLVIVFSDQPLVLFLLLIGLVALIHYIYPRPLLFYLICALGGASAESVAIYFGKAAWHYVLPTPPLNIPIWILPIWVNAAIFMTGTASVLRNSF